MLTVKSVTTRIQRNISRSLGILLPLKKRLVIATVRTRQLERSLGLLVITHSRIIAKELENDVFVNIDHGSYTKQDWLNRDIVPTDFDQFEKRSDALFATIRDRENKFKEKQKEE